AIAIRTLVATADRFDVQAGAGIVYDSVPEREAEETASKARAVLRAIEQARAIFTPDAPSGSDATTGESPS
ncbi:MAG TPA: chorismate-binding protein, partial [Candidatus Limnocylindrales bacterium]|nr:chorismate-binding protein [Candidatus Limnocylindrales bacterium]